MESGTSVTRLDPDAGERFQLVRRELGVTTFGINLITLQPGERGRIHEHERQEEAFVVLEGILDVVTPGGATELRAHDVMRVSPEIRRQLVNRGPGRCVVLALGGAQPHEGRDGLAYAAFDDAEPRAPQEIPSPTDLPDSELRG